ncbi:MAG: segregation/condensation protein A [Chloroflexota bacterium]
MDITKVSLARVTNPFLAYVRELKEFHAQEVSSFLVVAARLMQIKSEALLPRPPEREPGEEDPGKELIEQLRKYKQYKIIAEILTERVERGYRTYLRLAQPPKVEGKLDLSNVSVEDLFNAAKRVYELSEFITPSLDYVVHAPKVTIKEKIQHITQFLNRKRHSTFRILLGKGTSRNEIVATFLAMLELIKQFRINATQDIIFGEIDLEKADKWQEETNVDIEFTD